MFLAFTDFKCEFYECNFNQTRIQCDPFVRNSGCFTPTYAEGQELVTSD